MNKLVLIRDKQGYLTTSFVDHLRNAEFEVNEVEAKVDAANNYMEDIDGIIVYIDEAMSQNQELMIFVKDKIVEKDIPLFLIEGDKDLVAAKKYFPEGIITYFFSRPMDVRNCVEVIIKYYEKYASRSKKRILVVDDSGTMLRNVKGWLGEKYHVTLANSGTMAIKYMTLERPDLVLLDYEMPIISGKQVLEMIRSEADFATIPVMFLTAKSDVKSVMDVKSLNPQGYLLKTMGPKEIVKAVDEFLASIEIENRGKKLKI